jgi:putative ABC transport system permease protein
MMDSFYIAWKYLSRNRIKAVTLVSCIVLIAFLPVALELLLDESEKQLMSRAASTPLVIGARGSSLDLVMNTLYFGNEVPELIYMDAADMVGESGLAIPIPMYVRFSARRHPVVGTTVDYFDFRGLEVADGRGLAILGECLLGAGAAGELGLGVGDEIVTSPETMFDLAGVYPLKMKIVGVLKKTHTSDDLAVFIDIKTAWVIQGLMHGHQDLSKVKDPQLILKKGEGNITGSPKVFEYMEITEDNIESFHFHGDQSEYPITAVIAVPFDEKSGTILRGRYLGEEESNQIIRPSEVVDTLLENIFRIKNVLDAVIVVVGFGTFIAIILVFALSLRLRQREIETVFRIGCRRMTIARLMAAEIFLILAVSAAICTVLLAVVAHYDSMLVRILFIR